MPGELNVVAGKWRVLFVVHTGARQQPQQWMAAAADITHKRQLGAIAAASHDAARFQLNRLDGCLIVQYGVHLIHHDGNDKQAKEC